MKNHYQTDKVSCGINGHWPGETLSQTAAEKTTFLI